MLHFAIFSETCKIFTPYIRKHILLHLDPHEYFILNAFTIALICIIYILYDELVNKYKFIKLVKKYTELTPLQTFFICLTSFVTISSSLIILNMDKYYNTPLLNTMLMKFISVTLLILTGIFIFNETYSYVQILGMFLCIIGFIFIFYKPLDN